MKPAAACPIATRGCCPSSAIARAFDRRAGSAGRDACRRRRRSPKPGRSLNCATACGRHRCGNRALTANRDAMNLIERAFERLLWNSRLVTLVAVVASLVVALVMFYIASADVVYLAKEVSHYTALETEARAHLHRAAVAHVAEIVDGYLFATILIIFALGLYELFIGKIDAIESSPVASRVLLISSLDELKERLAKVVFLILIVRYFEYALDAPITNSLDLLYLAIGIALVAVSLYLTKEKPKPYRPSGARDGGAETTAP
jgi:uncharacterized membrane protein YqhA